MGASTERIALQIDASANVAEVAKARSEVSALGEKANEAAEMTRRAWAEAGGSLTRMAEAYARLTGQTQSNHAEIARGELALRRYEITQRRAEQAAYAMDAALEREQRRMVALHEEALRVDAALTAQSSTVEETGLNWERMGFRSRSALVALAFGLEGFARSAQAGESTMRAAVRSLSTLSFLLGPEVGIAVTGAAALGDALFEMWNRAEKAARAAQVQFEKTLETVSRGGLAGAAQSQQYLYSGDPFARRGAIAGETDAQFLARSRGLLGVQGALAALGPSGDVAQQRAIEAATARGIPAVQALNEGTKAFNAFAEAHKALIEQETRLKRELGETAEVTKRLMETEKSRAQFELQQMRERAALAQSRRLRPEEVPLTIGNLSEQERAFGITGTGFGAAAGIRGVSSIDLLAQAQSAAQRVDTTRLGRIQAAQITETPFHAMQVEMEKQIEALAARVQTHLGNTLADSLAAGITAGFAGGGIKGAFAAAGKSLLAGIGGIFIDLGKTYLEYSGIMEALTPLLGNPFTAGAAGAAIGTALIALGAALEGVGQRSGGGAGAAASANVFAANSAAAGGGTTVIINTIDPLSRGAISSTIYEINRSGMLNTPIVAPYGRPS